MGMRNPTNYPSTLALVVTQFQMSICIKCIHSQQNYVQREHDLYIQTWEDWGKRKKFIHS